MAAAACAAAAAVQRAQILMQAKKDDDSSGGAVNGESRRQSPLDDACTAADGDGAKKDLSRTKTEEDDLSNVGDDGNERSGATGSVPVGNEGSNSESLVESSSKNQQGCVANSLSNSSSDLSNAAPLLKEIIQGKLALAAAAAVAHRHNQEIDMEQTLAAARDFARHNNNDLKTSAEKAEPNPGAALMSQILKMRQEMALNMSLQKAQQQAAAQAAQRSAPSSPKIDPEDLDDDMEEEELPIDLQRTSEDGQSDRSERSQTSPRSPSSDAGLSTSSAGKADKASRLEHIVSSINRASPSLPKEAQNAPQNAVNGCKKRKLYQPVQAKSSDEGETPDLKKIREDQDQNDENADPKINGEAGSHPPGAQQALQIHYMEMMAKKFLQEQQDKATKEAITKEILADTVGKNNDIITEKLVSISPDLKGLAEVIKTEITSALAVMIGPIVNNYLQMQRNNNASAAQAAARASIVGLTKPGFNLPGSGNIDNSDILPPMPSLKTNTPSGRAPQVRDRAAPRSNGGMPVSMYNPAMKFTPPVTTTSTAFPLPPTLRPAPGLLQPTTLAPSTTTTSTTSLNNNNSEDEGSAPSPSGGRDLSPPEQDEALSLVVTPKKRRHKVTDTRITPRTLSRVLGEQPALAELHKTFPHFAAGLKEGPRAGPGAPGSHPLFPGLPAPPGLLSGLPTSVAIPNPSLSDFNPFSFYSPPHLPSSAAATPPGLPAVRDNKPKMMMSATPPLEKSKSHRERHHSSSDLGRDDATPPSMLRHPSLLSRGSPDFAARLRDDRERDIDEFDRMPPFFGAGKFL